MNTYEQVDLGKPLRNQLYFQLYNRLYNQLLNQLDYQPRNQIYIQLDNENKLAKL